VETQEDLLIHINLQQLKDFDISFENCETYSITVSPDVVSRHGQNFPTFEAKEVNFTYITEPRPPHELIVRETEKC
jgi:hypothetical protein